MASPVSACKNFVCRSTFGNMQGVNNKTGLISILLAVTGCSAPDASGFGTISGVDTSRSGLEQFTESKGYRTWEKEAAVHPSAGPHGLVQTWFNAELWASLQKGQNAHPRGSATVKELFESDGQTLSGYAVMVKIADPASKDSWLYYEGFLDEQKKTYYGVAHESCHGCHAAGVDYVVSKAPVSQP